MTTCHEMGSCLRKSTDRDEAEQSKWAVGFLGTKYECSVSGAMYLQYEVAWVIKMKRNIYGICGGCSETLHLPVCTDWNLTEMDVGS